MASIQELFRTGFVFAEISHDQTYPGSTLELFRFFRFPPRNQYALSAQETVAMDLEEYLMDRLYDVEISMRGGVNKLNEEYWNILGRKDNGIAAMCAMLTYSGQGLTINLPQKSERLYPDVGIPASQQRIALLEDYSQLFKYTNRGIATGRHIPPPRKIPQASYFR